MNECWHDEMMCWHGERGRSMEAWREYVNYGTKLLGMHHFQGNVEGLCMGQTSIHSFEKKQIDYEKNYFSFETII